MQAFTYTAHPARVIFGSGKLRTLPDELARQKLTAPLVLCTPEQAEHAAMVTGLLASTVGTFAEATMHTPTHVTEKALKYAAERKADCIVSVGGGSTIGLGKALSIRNRLPHICIPTTYAGSEMTPILGETENGVKATRSDPRILPGTVIYDADLTAGLPVGMSCTSGVNAIAHAVEALYSPTTNPIINLLAVEGIRSLADALPQLVAAARNQPAREKALYGAWLCGACLGAVGMSLHHKLCHVLGGTFNLPHAETHAIVLPHALSYNQPKLSADVVRSLAGAFPGADGDPVKGLNVLLQKLGVERALSKYGMKETDVDRAADLAVAKPYPNPRELKRDELREVIRRACVGEDARADI